MIQRDSNLDLLFCTEGIMGLIDYEQEEEPGDSDHLPIIYTLGINTEIYERKTYRITNKKTKWKIYTKELNRREEKIKSEQYQQLTEEKKYYTMTRIMQESAWLATYGKTWKKKVIMEGDNIRKRYPGDSLRGHHLKNPAQ